MILRGHNDTLFELKVLRYEHPEAKNDHWRMNLLRISISVRTADGNEGTCETYLLMNELKCGGTTRRKRMTSGKLAEKRAVREIEQKLVKQAKGEKQRYHCIQRT